MVRARCGYLDVVHIFARFLQMIGLLIVPMALFYGMEGGDTRGIAMRELVIMAIGAGIFVLGRALEARIHS